MAAPTMRVGSSTGDGGGDEGGALYLTVMGPDLFFSHALPAAGTLTIGRDESANVRINDPDGSRYHARLHVGERIELEDLKSKNGTRLGERLVPPGARVAVQPGEAIGIGWTVLVVKRRRAPAPSRRVRPHGYFEARLEEECESATSAGATFATLRVQVRPAAELPRALQVVARTLRPTDVLASYGPDQLEVLLVDTATGAAEALAAALTEGLTQASIQHRVVTSCFPRDGRSTDVLIAHATARLRDVGTTEPDDPVIASEPLRMVYRLARRAARAPINVLILGETGTGKELMAQAIHRYSLRAAGPFVCINCAALSEALLESELFGHERGAFTGAVQAKRGRLETASGGTVFLDEVGEMPIGIQAKLLRAIEQKEVTRVGALISHTVDVRFVAATNRDIEAEIERRAFRADLYFRLNGITLTLPPLRDQVAEISLLFERFLDGAARMMGRPPPRLSPAALALLESYAWPGNIRELRNAAERALILCDGGLIGVEHLPVEKMNATPRPPTLPQPVWQSDDSERQRIIDALKQHAGNQTKVARVLGVSRRTLCDKLKRYQIQRPRD